MNQHATASYSELIRTYGDAIFKQACALAKTSPLSVEDACKRLKAAKDAATAKLMFGNLVKPEDFSLPHPSSIYYTHPSKVSEAQAALPGVTVIATERLREDLP